MIDFSDAYYPGMKSQDALLMRKKVDGVINAHTEIINRGFKRENRKVSREAVMGKRGHPRIRTILLFFGACLWVFGCTMIVWYSINVGVP